MSNPTKIDREFFRAFRSALEDAIAAVAEKHGVSVKVGRASYAYTNGSIKLEIAQLSEDGTAVTPEGEQADRVEQMARELYAQGRPNDAMRESGRSWWDKTPEDDALKPPFRRRAEYVLTLIAQKGSK